MYVGFANQAHGFVVYFAERGWVCIAIQSACLGTPAKSRRTTRGLVLTMFPCIATSGRRSVFQAQSEQIYALGVVPQGYYPSLCPYLCYVKSWNTLRWVRGGRHLASYLSIGWKGGDWEKWHEMKHTPSLSLNYTFLFSHGWQVAALLSRHFSFRDCNVNARVIYSIFIV
jgi:hypothetical protein